MIKKSAICVWTLPIMLDTRCIYVYGMFVLNPTEQGVLQMDNVRFVAVNDFCRNVANDVELAKLKASIAYREAELERRALLLQPKPDPLAVTRGIVDSHRYYSGDQEVGPGFGGAGEALL